MRKIFAALLATGVSVGIGLVTPQTASADLVIGTCPLGTSTITYTPGVTDEPNEVFQQGFEQSGPCIFTPLTLRTFTDTFSGPLTTSCTELLTGSDSGTQTFVWNDGRESFWSFSSVTAQTVSGNTVATYTGPLSDDSEYLPGVTVVQVVTYFNLTVESCSANPLTEQSGTSTYTFIRA